MRLGVALDVGDVARGSAPARPGPAVEQLADVVAVAGEQALRAAGDLEGAQGVRRRPALAWRRARPTRCAAAAGARRRGSPGCARRRGWVAAIVQASRPPRSVPTTIASLSPSEVTSWAMSAARFGASYPRGGLSLAPNPRRSTATAWKPASARSTSLAVIRPPELRESRAAAGRAGRCPVSATCRAMPFARTMRCVHGPSTRAMELSGDPAAGRNPCGSAPLRVGLEVRDGVLARRDGALGRAHPLDLPDAEEDEQADDREQLGTKTTR